MGGVAQLYKQIWLSPRRTAKKHLDNKTALTILIANITIASVLLGIVAFYKEPTLILPAILVGIGIGIISLLYATTLLHIVFRIFSKENYSKTLSVTAHTSILFLVAWIPFVNYFAGLWSLIILFSGLNHNHEVPWWKTLIVLLLVAIIQYTLLFILGELFGGVQ